MGKRSVYRVPFSRRRFAIHERPDPVLLRTTLNEHIVNVYDFAL